MTGALLSEVQMYRNMSLLQLSGFHIKGWYHAPSGLLSQISLSIKVTKLRPLVPEIIAIDNSECEVCQFNLITT